MNIKELVKWLYSLSDVLTFKEEMKKMVSFYETDTVEVINSDKAKLKVVEKSQVTGDYTDRTVSFEGEIIRRTKSVIKKPAENIAPLAEQAEKLVQQLEMAEQIADQTQFHKSFPKYFDALEATKKTIRKTTYAVGIKKEKRGNPNLKGLSLSNKVKIINLAEQLLQDKPNDFEARAGAYVSEYLKTTVFDELKNKIPDLSIHKVKRVLLKHYKTKKNL